MTKLLIHTDDLPKWAVKKQKLPKTYLGFLREEIFPSPDGKGLESFEDRILRQHWDGMLAGNLKARDWLLEKVMKDNAAVLSAAPERAIVTINGIHHFQPLGPVLEILGFATVGHSGEGTEASPTVTLSDGFVEVLRKRCKPHKLATVLAWQEAGGHQKPRLNPDRVD